MFSNHIRRFDKTLQHSLLRLTQLVSSILRHVIWKLWKEVIGLRLDLC